MAKKTRKQLKRKVKSQKRIIRELVNNSRVERTTTWEPGAPKAVAAVSNVD